MATNQTQVFTGTGIDYFRFASIKAQLKMEKVGLKSSGGALRPRLAQEFGLKARDSHDLYIAHCVAQMEKAMAAREMAPAP